MNNELISVVMSAYNEKGNWFIKSIESILNQTYKNIELIVFIDNPKNNELIEIAQRYEKKDKRIKLIINEKNKGLVYCLNKGIELSNGRFIARMDADDISELDRFEKQFNYLNLNPECILVGSQMKLIDEEDKCMVNNISFPIENKKIKKMLKLTNTFCHPSILFIKDYVVEIGGYRDIAYAEDYDLITRIVINGGKIANINEKLINYRVRKNGICQSNLNTQRQSEKYIKNNFKKRKIDNIKTYRQDFDLKFNENFKRKIDRLVYRILTFLHF